MPERGVDIDVRLVRDLVASQFPRWAGLPVRTVGPGGRDNRTFRLGDDMSVRLPSAECYAGQAAKEHRWLPVLAPRLPLTIPVPLAMGAPGMGFPWPWSVRRWLEGEDATSGRIDDLPGFAVALARFLAALQGVDARGGPPPGPHNFHRGGPPGTYDAEVREAMDALGGAIDAGAATAAWEAALGAPWDGTTVWLHGDVGPGNLLVRGGRLVAVLDFGCSGVGDPACDLAIAWTLFSGTSREAFRAGLPLDAGTWARGRGWALWKALITMAGIGGADPREAGRARSVLDALLADPGRAA